MDSQSSGKRKLGTRVSPSGLTFPDAPDLQKAASPCLVASAPPTRALAVLHGQMPSPVLASCIKFPASLLRGFTLDKFWCSHGPLSVLTWVVRQSVWQRPSLARDLPESFEPAGDWTFPEIRSTDELDAALREVEYDPLFQLDDCSALSEGEWNPDLTRDFPGGSARVDGDSVSPIMEVPLAPLDTYPSVQTSDKAIHGLHRNGEIAGFSASLCAHLFLIGLLVLGYMSMTAGTGQANGNSITVRLLARTEVTPEEERPASLDSPASPAAVAAKAPDPMVRRRKESPTEVAKALEKSDQAPTEHPASKDEDPKNLEKREETDTRVSQRSDIKVKSPDNADSAPSTPSTASPERSLPRAQAKHGDRFKGQVLSAIHQAAFFPQQAHSRALHGEVIVAFTINRDGSVCDLVLTKSSGSDVLDDTARRIVQKASKEFPPIPEEMMTQAVTYEVPIKFRTRSSRNSL
jgi:periplasmic protein TonB